MKVLWLLPLLPGCVAAPPRDETPLEKLRAKTNGYSSFHYKAELTDGKVVVPIELAWRAPDRALLRYGAHYTIFLVGGVAHHFERNTYTAYNYVDMLETLRLRYGDLLPSAPKPAFTLGGWELPIQDRGLLAGLEIRPLGSRLSWLSELESWLVEGNVYRKGTIEIELRDDGFIQRAKMGDLRPKEFVLKTLSIDLPLDEHLFELPPRDETADLSEARRPRRLEELDDAFHRWVLADRPDDAALEALVKVDLARLYDPPKMIDFQKKTLQSDLEPFLKDGPSSPKALELREKIEIARGKAMGGLEVVEEDVQKEFQRRLDRLLGATMAAALAERWREAVAHQFDLQIRRPVERVFSDQSKE